MAGYGPFLQAGGGVVGTLILIDSAELARELAL
jgi:hypothetical protein